MTKKLDTPAEDQTDSPRAHDDDEQGRKRGFGFVWLLLAVAVIGGGLWVVDQGYLDHLLYPEQEPAIALPPKPSTPMQKEPEADPVFRNDISAIRASQTASERERAQLRRDVERMESEIAKLNKNISIMMESIEEIKKLPTTIAVTTAPQPDSGNTDKLQEQVASLTARLDSLKQDYTQRNNRHATQLKLAQLADAITQKAAAGEPFAGEMLRLQPLAAQLELDAGTVEVLETHAREGIPSLAALVRLFGETAQIALPYSLGDERSLSDDLRSNLAHIISIRKIEVEATDASDEAHIARAEAELRTGNVEMALTHLEQLSEQPRSLFYGWQEQAHDYLDVHHAIDRLKTVAMQRPGME